jgi:glycosyltransferase involved in cell wall biosynthesis
VLETEIAMVPKRSESALNHVGTTLETTPSSEILVVLNIAETRTWNFIAELKRRGFVVVEFRTNDWKNVVTSARAFCRAARSSRFVLCGIHLPFQLPWMLLVKAIGRQCVLDLPMDITTWPFPEKGHWKWLVGKTLRMADLVLTIRSRSYLAPKFGIDKTRMAYLESCPDAQVVMAGLDAKPRYKPAPGAFTVCLSGGHEAHRLERFMPVFEALLPLIPNVELLIISARSKPVVRLSLEYASRAGFDNRVRVLPVIKPPEEFFATVAQCQLWVATLGDDTLQGRQEFRMELIEVGLMGKPAVLTVRTPAIVEHDLVDGREIIELDLSDPAGTASRIAALADEPGALARIASNMRQRVLGTYSLSEAVNQLLQRIA